jgi:flagella basal body P-ring formation protein FlgA
MSRATSFASPLLAVLVGSSALVAQATEQPAEVSAVLAERVAWSIAEVWRTEPALMELRWGLLNTDQPLPDDVALRLIGRGTDGWFAVVFERSDQSVVAARVRAGVADTVIVAARPLQAGTSLTAGDFERTVRTRWAPPRSGEIEFPDVGWEVRRAIAAGTELTAHAVSRPYVIAAGEPVRLVWRRGAVVVSVSGVALNAARIGDQVRARVAGRSGRMHGIASAPGTAGLVGGDT